MDYVRRCCLLLPGALLRDGGPRGSDNPLLIHVQIISAPAKPVGNKARRSWAEPPTCLCGIVLLRQGAAATPAPKRSFRERWGRRRALPGPRRGASVRNGVGGTGIASSSGPSH